MYNSLMRLVQIFGAANPKIHEAIKCYGDAVSACEAIDRGKCKLLDNAQRENAKLVTRELMDKVIEWCNSRDIKLLALEDNDYPKLLKRIFNPPVLLFYRGSLKCLDRLCITAVGARKVTPYIEKITTRICADLSQSGVTIVSGMADGVDSAAIRGCLKNGNPTVGVLACGMSYEYPRGSSLLRQSMVLNGGLILTELLPNVSPNADYFEQRNRIMAGLSKGTAVFQADNISGSLITANHAVREGREVFCVPPPEILNKKYEGVIGLLRDGAIPLFNHEDILKHYK